MPADPALPSTTPARCAITGRPIQGDEASGGEATRFALMRPRLAAWLLRQHPGLAPDDWISAEAVDAAREAYVRDLLEMEMG